METALRLVTATILLAGLTGPPAEARATVDTDFCGLYCDAIYVGCQATIGKLDEDACLEYHKGCLDGCEVEHD